MQVEIYDPPMCCSSGLCGPSIDPVLIRVNDAVLALKKQGVTVERYNLKVQLKEFVANQIVTDLMRQNGKTVLPITIVNGEVLKTGEYPSYEDLCKALVIEPLQKGKPVTLKLN